MLPRKEYRTGLLTVGCAVLAFLLAAASMILTKRPWVDEGWFTGPALDLTVHGRMGTPLLDPAGSHLRLQDPNAELRGIKQHTYWVMPAHLLQLALWGRLFGFSVFSMRMPSVLWGLITLASVFIIIRRLEVGRWAAEIAVAVLALDFGFLDSAADARMDMTCAALGFAALAAYLSLRDKYFRGSLVASHSLAAASCFTHPNGSFAAVALVVTMVYLDRKRWKEMNPALILGPYAIGGFAWWLYCTQSPSDFSAQFSANAAGRMSDLLAPWRGIWREVAGRFMNHYWPAGSWSGKLKIVGLLLALVAAAVLVGVRQLWATTGCRLIVLLTLLRFILLSIAADTKNTYYMVQIVPYFAMLIGIAGSYALRRRGGRVRVLAAVTLILYFMVQGATLWHKAVTVNGYASEYQPLVSFIKSISHPDDEIVGAAELGFELGFYNPQLADDVWLGYWSHRRPTIIVVDRWYYKDVMDVATQRGFPTPHYFDQLLTTKFVLIKDLRGYQVYRRLN